MGNGQRQTPVLSEERRLRWVVVERKQRKKHKMVTAKKTKKKKIVVATPEMRISIYASFNNTIISANSWQTGETVATSSCGMVGFKGAKKGTPYAATLATKELLDRIATREPKTFHVFVSGAGNGRDAVLRALASSGVQIASIKDITPMPHNGCRAKKARRV